MKPVRKEDILSLLHNVSTLEKEDIEKKENQQKLEDAYLARNVIALIKGKFDEGNLEYVNEHISALKLAENDFQDLLDEISLLIGKTVSEAVKVPVSNPFFASSSSSCGTGCGTGGSCSCSA